MTELIKHFHKDELAWLSELGKYTISFMIPRVPEISFCLIGEGHTAPIPGVSARRQWLSAASEQSLPEDTQWQDSRT